MRLPYVYRVVNPHLTIVLSESHLMFYVGQMCVHMLAYQSIIIAVLSKSE